jgi:7-cyano-7-deazaguanine synthase in queuosine biosynthesis
VISLLMLSGGFDSTYALHKLLTETDDEVLVHHIHLLTDQNRHIPEAESCRKIVAYCRTNLRPFHYSESSIDHRGFSCHGFDLIAAGLEVGVVASSYGWTHQRKKTIDRWIIGIARDDEVAPDRFGRAQICCEANCQFIKPPRLFLFPAVSPTEQFDELPRQLFDLTWSCRTPNKAQTSFVPCRACKSCQRRERLVRKVPNQEHEPVLA